MGQNLAIRWSLLYFSRRKSQGVIERERAGAVACTILDDIQMIIYHIPHAVDLEQACCIGCETYLNVFITKAFAQYQKLGQNIKS